MSHFTYEWVMSNVIQGGRSEFVVCYAHMNEKVVSHMNEWVVSHMNESCHMWMRHVKYNTGGAVRVRGAIGVYKRMSCVACG